MKLKPKELIEYLKESGMCVFRVNDIHKFTGNRSYSYVLLNRMIKKGVVCRLYNNVYYITNSNPFSVASMVHYPSYVSYLGSLYLSGICDQIPMRIQVVTNKYSKNIFVGKIPVEFVSFSKKLMFGYIKKNLDGCPVFIGEPEKTVLDALHVQKMPFHYIIDVLDKLDHAKLIEYSKRFDNAVIKRIGYLMDISGNDYYNELKHLLNKRYVFLVKEKLKTGKKIKKWRIIDNRWY
ncbi:hypothetical protein J7J90_03645 [Candidatus Micrarchaeota archaeon]|nr:hypothetical protein [Candidatus Micrarchaeota archaeon]